MRETKQDVLDDIAKMIRKPSHPVSVGSTELKGALTDINDALHLGLDPGLSKPELAEAIAGRGGIQWDDDCDSRNTPSGGGSTVTLEGLRRLRDAVRQMRGRL